ncbi:hypothetical protein GCM10022262_37830 [Georgenia daeguensis]|uniref:Uncharacterized protein n=1 Tax=Georgenia daeguensis TaxID=908355 RepID=A0ABP6UNY8_9MICO
MIGSLGDGGECLQLTEAQAGESFDRPRDLLLGPRHRGHPLDEVEGLREVLPGLGALDGGSGAAGGGRVDVDGAARIECCISHARLNDEPRHGVPQL